MFVVNSLPVAIIFCVITMLGWGSWANTQKLAGKEKWPFQLFYWDYAIGVFLFGMVFAHTLGSFGAAGAPTRENLHQASWSFVVPALISGVIFNLSNILLVVGIDAAGMSVAFPVGVGLALVIGTVESYVETPKGDPGLLFTGVALIVFAMIMSALAHKRLPHGGVRNPLRGVVYSAIAGALMGFFYPQLMRAISPNFNSAPIVPGHADSLRGAGVFRRGRAGQQLFVEHHLHAHGQGDVWRLFPRQRPAARHRHPGRRHLDARAELQRDRVQRGGSGGVLRAGTGRDPGGGDLGAVHLARVPRGAGGDQQISRADARPGTPSD